MASRKGVGASRKLAVLHPPPRRCSWHRGSWGSAVPRNGTLSASWVPNMSSGPGMWLWALPVPMFQVLGWAGLGAASMLGSAVVPVAEHPGMGWDWKCGRCRRAQPSPGACHTPVVPGLAAPFPERVASAGTV